MNRRKVPGIWLFVAVGVLVGTGLCEVAPRGVAQEPKVPVTAQNFMKAKLQHSQKILEGLALENFDLITQNAQDLSLLSLESHWNVMRTQKYVDQSNEFRHAIERLIDAAKAKDMDATALAYMDVTLKCIHCHKYVRSNRNGAKESVGLQELHRIPSLIGD